MAKSLFSDWFIEQHGPRERKEPNGLVVDDDSLRAAIRHGEAAAEELRRREFWDAKRTSALYAWAAHSCRF